MVLASNIKIEEDLQNGEYHEWWLNIFEYSNIK